MSVTQDWIICCDMWYGYEIGMRILFSKQYKYVTNYLHLYVTNYCIFVCTITVLLLTSVFSLVHANISSNTTFTTFVIFHQISSGPMDPFFLLF